jgi:hypothetical protein
MAKKAAGEGDGPKTKMDAVRAALSAGVTKPAEGVAYLKEQFNIGITPQMFSAYKSNAKKKRGRRGRPPGRRAASGVGNGNAQGATAADLARDVKRLVEQYGAAAVKDMAKVFAE